MYNSHKKYIKTGECNRCGACCNQHCDHLNIQAIRNISEGEMIVAGVDTHSNCVIFSLDTTHDGCGLEQRVGFPFDPWQTPEKCGFKWVEIDE